MGSISDGNESHRAIGNDNDIWRKCDCLQCYCHRARQLYIIELWPNSEWRRNDSSSGRSIIKYSRTGRSDNFEPEWTLWTHRIWKWEVRYLDSILAVENWIYSCSSESHLTTTSPSNLWMAILASVTITQLQIIHTKQAETIKRILTLWSPKWSRRNHLERRRRNRVNSIVNTVSWNIRAKSVSNIIWLVMVRTFKQVVTTLICIFRNGRFQVAMVRSSSSVNAVHVILWVLTRWNYTKPTSIPTYSLAMCAKSDSRIRKVCTITWSTCTKSRKKRKRIKCARNAVSSTEFGRKDATGCDSIVDFRQKVRQQLCVDRSWEVRLWSIAQLQVCRLWKILSQCGFAQIASTHTLWPNGIRMRLMLEEISK